MTRAAKLQPNVAVTGMRDPRYLCGVETQCGSHAAIHFGSSYARRAYYKVCLVGNAVDGVYHKVIAVQIVFQRLRANGADAAYTEYDNTNSAESQHALRT